MEPENTPPSQSKVALWVSYIMSAIPVLMLIFSGVMKLVQPAGMMENVAKMQFPVALLLPIGIVELLCTVLYIIPRTSVLGAILLTGYLGGAVETHVRLQESFLFPLAFGVLIWGGLFLRDARIRDLIPLRKPK